jgi:hypothetical protein
VSISASPNSTRTPGRGDGLVPRARSRRSRRPASAAHLAEGSLLGYDLPSCFVEGAHNELAAFGHSRDGKRAKRRVEYGVVATREGLPVTIEVFPDNTSDPKSFVEIVEATKARFGLSRDVFVGDRGMITSAPIVAPKETGGFGWVTACGLRRSRRS